MYTILVMNDVSKIGIYPSIMCAKSWEIKEYLKLFEGRKIDAVHFDIMDGHYVPNITIGSNLLKDIREISDLPLDLHFMVERPESIIPFFELKEGDSCCFHPETSNDPYRLLQFLKEKGVKAGLAISQSTPLDYVENTVEILDYLLVMAVNPGFAGQKMLPDHLNKLKRISELLSSRHKDIEIVVDGNTNLQNSCMMLKNGATGFVAGTSSLFRGGPEKFNENYDLYMEGLKNG